MVTLTSLASVISMAILATVTSAAPSVLTTRQAPPTTSALDLTLYKTTQPGYENQCWIGVDIAHVAPAEIGNCYQSDFYVLRIDHLATGYACQVNVFDDNSCNNRIGYYEYNTNYAPCTFPSSSGLVDLHSWSVTCA